MQERGYAQRLLYIALAITGVITALWLMGYIGLRSALSLVGLGWDICGATILAVGLLSQHGAALRARRMEMEENKSLPTDWVRRFAVVVVAFHLAPKDVRATEEISLDTFSDTLWGLLLLMVGFFLQAMSQLPWVKSDPLVILSTVSLPWKEQWTLGLFFLLSSVVLPHGSFSRWFNFSFAFLGPHLSAFLLGLQAELKDSFSQS